MFITGCDFRNRKSARQDLTFNAVGKCYWLFIFDDLINKTIRFAGFSVEPICIFHPSGNVLDFLATACCIDIDHCLVNRFEGIFGCFQFLYGLRNFLGIHRSPFVNPVGTTVHEEQSELAHDNAFGSHGDDSSSTCYEAMKMSCDVAVFQEHLTDLECINDGTAQGGDIHRAGCVSHLGEFVLNEGGWEGKAYWTIDVNVVFHFCVGFDANLSNIYRNRKDKKNPSVCPDWNEILTIFNRCSFHLRIEDEKFLSVFRFLP